MAIVRIPASLRRLTDGATELEVQAGTVRLVIDELERRFPGMAARLREGDRLRPGLAVAVDSRISDVGILERVGPDSEVVFLPSLSGG